MLIRALAPSDSPLLAALHAAAFPPGEAWGEDAFARLVALPGAVGVLAAEGGVPVGFVLARRAADEAEILALAVVPERRRRGVGRALLEACLEALAGQGVGRVFLEVAADNAGARALYGAAGFVSAGLRRNYYGAGRDALLLVRALSPPCAG